MVRFSPPISLFWHWKCALSLETTLSYLAKSKVDNPASVLCLKSPQSKKCQSLWTPELENPTQLYPLEIPPHVVSVVAMVMPTATSVTAMRAAAIPYPQAHLSGMWTPIQVLFWHFLHFVEPLPQSHEVEIISCLFRQRSSLKPSRHLQSYLPPLLDAHIMKWLFM